MRGLDSAYFNIPSLRPGTVGAYAFAVFCAAAATVLRIVLEPYVAGVPFITFFPAAIITALISGFGAGLFCILLSATAAAFLFLPPRLSFYVESPADVMELLLFISLSFFLVILVAALKQAGQELQVNKDRLLFALDAAGLGWWEYDPVHDVVRWDERTREIFKVPETQTSIEEFKKRVHTDDIQGVWAAVDAALDPTDPKPYVAEYRIQVDTSTTRWVEGHWLAQFVGTGLQRRAQCLIGTAEDITERKRLQQEQVKRQEKERLLMREVNHRAKNMLSIVDAIAHQTAAKNPENFIECFSERIQALSANQDLLVRNQWHGIEVDQLVRTQLLHFADLIGSRIVMDGPRLRLNAASAQAIGLALHELATNAGKYGALSTDTGCVDVHWWVDDNVFTIGWTEREGPPVSAPQHRGFGTVVMKEMAERSVDGEVSIDYASSGVTWHLTCPAANALELAASWLSHGGHEATDMRPTLH